LSEYLQTATVDGAKIKDIYRIRSIFDEESKDWLRDKDGNLDGTDIYIECPYGDMIYDIDPSKRIMQAYITSIGRGRNILKVFYTDILGLDLNKFNTKANVKPKFDDDGNIISSEDKIVFDVEAFLQELNSIDKCVIYKIFENDEEVQFDFHLSNIKPIAGLLKAKKPMATTSAYNSKYLPAHKEKLAADKLEEARFVKYEMPKGYWGDIKKLLPTLMKQKSMMLDKVLNNCYKEFGKSIKINLLKDSDANNYKINHYIHHLGQWDNFVLYVNGMVNV